MTRFTDCEHFGEETDSCAINKGTGWSGEYCSLAYLGKDCGHCTEDSDVASSHGDSNNH